MSEQPPYPQDPNHPPSGSTPPPPPPPGGYGTPPPPPPGGYGAPPPPGGYGSPPPPPAPGGYGGPPAGPSYDVIEAVKYGWQKFTANWGAFVVIALLAVAVPGVISLIGSGFSSGGSGVFSEPDASGGQMAFGGGLSLVGALFSIASQVVSVFFTAAMVRAGLDATEGRAVDVSSAFTRWSFLQVLLLALIVGVGTFVGILLCVIPGLVFIFFTWFGNYFVVGRGESGPSAVRSSMQFTAANIGSLLLLMLVSVLVVIAGALACLVGLLVAIPVITIAAAYTFKVLQGEPVAP